MGEAMEPIGYQFVENHLTHEIGTAEVADLYRKWAKDYDKDVTNHGYILIPTFTEIFDKALNEAGFDKNVRIIDLGAGTGLAAEALKKYNYENIDGLDLSPEMLEIAQRKGLYKEVYCESLGEGRLSIPHGIYDVVISTGTFTTGHVKPAGFDEAVQIARKDGLIAFSIRADAFHSKDFGYEEKINELEKNQTWSIIKKEYVDYDRKYQNPLQRKGYVYICRKN